VFISGRTAVDTFPFAIPPGAFQPIYGGGSPVSPHFGGDFYVAKLNPNFAGPSPVWFTYVGGMNDDTGRGRLAIDSQGNVYVGGAGRSTADFPVGMGPALPNIPASQNFGALIKLSSDGSKLLWTKVFFGTIPVGGAPIFSNASGGTIVDKNDNVYTCGFTTAQDFLKSSGAPMTGFQTTLHGPADAYVAKLSPSGTVLAATLIGGMNDNEECKGLVQDVEGNVILITPTASPDYPTTPGAFSQTLPASATSNMAVTKLTPDLSHLVFSTFVGGNTHEEDDAARIELDAYENMWFAFFTQSTDLVARNVVTPNAFQVTMTENSMPKTCNPMTNTACASVAFVKLSSDGSKILYGSYLGGTNQDGPRTLRYRKN
jgi:hypothetical protein